MDYLKIELMSSEESDGEEDKLIVRPPSWREIPVILSWRSADTNKFIELLDGPIHKNKSAQSKRQMKERIPGLLLKHSNTRIYSGWLLM